MKSQRPELQDPLPAQVAASGHPSEGRVAGAGGNDHLGWLDCVPEGPWPHPPVQTVGAEFFSPRFTC